VAFQRKKPAAIGTKANYPGFIEPALASSIERVPNGERWVHEIKFDGYRVQVHLANESIQVFTRRGNDWTKRFKKIADDAWQISATSAIIDGEVVVPAADGTTDFSVLQNELKGTSTKIVMVAFDLMYLNGYDLRKLPLFERKALLKKLRPRLLSDNGASYVASDLASWLEGKGMQHVRGAPYHPQTQGKIERWHQTLKNRILLDNYYLPGDLERQIGAFVEHYNHIRYHESIDNLTPADVYFGKAQTILAERRRIKLATIANRRLQHRLQAA
jgi:hypothetical protein